MQAATACSVEVQQQYIGASTTALEGLPSALPTPSPFTFIASTFQYLPAESAESALPEEKESDRPRIFPSDIHSYKDFDWQASSDHDHPFTSKHSTHGKLGKFTLSSLAECWHSVDRKARLWLQWWKEILGLSAAPSCHAGTRQWTEDVPNHNDDSSWQYVRPDAKIRPGAFNNDTNVLSHIPQYVMDYAPLVHLYSNEEYWPCDMGEHLYHITPKLNYTPVQSSLQHLQLDNLSALNRWEYGRNMFLTSNDNVEDRPEWLLGEKNIPTTFSQQSKRDASSQKATKAIQGGRSDAPAVLVVVNKGHGIVDAFWFFFYSFNLGNMVVLRFGNHVGDWEHTLVRFHNGKPKAVFVSEHFFGQAYTYRAMEKVGKRPVVYSATGTHAMYATPGTHAYILPWGLLHDQTDKGPLWDPALNSHMYTYNLLNDSLRASNLTPTAPTEWFHFAGHWGDKQYPLDDPRQYLFAGNYHYVSGPLGPKFKNLGRRKICQGRESEPCVVKNWLGGSRLRRVHRPFEEEELSEEERVRFATGDRNV
ncbi:hypothetical protein EPUS_04721 [Endocarpon pusillum Z07020]|uniref:Vacuolar protein sorting-associated protein 62 n=1 Tax=Endocarpon pusillum (strain Z07020 / HMAS-L-300199) TaxID=1263415 RepID=U1GEC5_ENDPU|nr:uncharacterized protein EPUS_04721 [Endocarpon pusillum Z07020]ERF70443.1 hypothetical protein EPUS_04721 [Endocarpon pusillum Z07020]